MICSTIFQFKLRVPLSEKKSTSTFDSTLQTWQAVCSICRSSKLYFVALIHTTSRLSHSLILTYIPFFINETNVKNSGVLAIAPFLNFSAALVSSLVVNYLTKKSVNNKVRLVFIRNFTTN